MHRRTRWEERGEKDGFGFVTDPPILSSKRKMVVRKGTQGIQKAERPSGWRWSKWGNRGGRKKELKKQAERNRKRQWRALHARERRAGFQARCLCAVWITTGSWCPRLVYIKLRQLLDFPHNCCGTGLLRSPTVVSAIISWRPEGTRSRRSPATCRPSPAAAVLRMQIAASSDKEEWGGGTRLDTWCASKPSLVVLCQGWQRSPDPWSPVRPQGTPHSCALVPSLSHVCPLLH